jgi:DNA-binding SARP family transcriptional activator
LLLARLTLHPRSHRRDELVAMFWPGVEFNAGRQSLSQALSELRRQLDAEILRANHDTVCLASERFSSDVGDFERALAAAHAATGHSRIAALERGVAVSTAPLLPGVSFEWAVSARERILAETDAMLRELSEHYEQSGELATAFEYTFRRVRIDPLDEEAHRELVRLYEHAGRPLAALAHLRDLEQDLERGLGVAPDAETRAMTEALRERLLALKGQPVA